MKRPTLANAAGFILGGIVLAVPFLVFADDKFVPLTQLPGLSTISASAISLPSFINNLYKISIGLAAFFAFTQIVQAGYMFMTSADSISKNTQARAKIMNAIFGLVIVLSPFVIFSIINPKILDISLNFKSLQSANGTATPGSGTANNNPGNQSGTGSEAASPSSCTAAGFKGITIKEDPPGCIALGGNYTDIAPGCCAGMTSGHVCCGDSSGL